MSKYINQSERVHIIGEKFSIPGGEAIELTADEESNPMIKQYIADGKLVKVPEAVAEVTTDNTDSNDANAKGKK